jgi:parallel beta-helix repeat protein
MSFVLPPAEVLGKVLIADTVWSGEISITEDILVPQGVTLTVAPGTIVTVVASDSSKTDPEYLSPLTEITIRGKLLCEGTSRDPIFFRRAGGQDQNQGWAGIIIDGGTASVKSCHIEGAETGMYVINSVLSASECEFTNNKYGLVADGARSKIILRNTRVTGNDYGLFVFNKAIVESAGSVINKNSKKDTYKMDAREYTGNPEGAPVANKEITRHYQDEILLQDTVWQGVIEVGGLIRVPEGSRLVILPGTIIDIRKKDTNGDGIGENGLLIQGLLLAKGSKEHPIIFRSGEQIKNAGDWDGINIMSSDGALNLIEYCRIEDGYRGVHFHFSNVAIKNSVFNNNYRAIQFQESNAEVEGNIVDRNRSGIQARDSIILIRNNRISNNFTGANFFRSRIEVSRNIFANNVKEGLRIRESLPTCRGNTMYGNRNGFLVQDALYGNFEGNLVVHNLESGISIRNTDAVHVAANYVQGNGLNGITVQNSAALIEKNVISLNGERGIAVSDFTGIITGNSLLRNGLYSVGTEGKTDIAAPGNWWGNENLKTVIYDKEDDSTRGRVTYDPVDKYPSVFLWPLDDVPVDITLFGGIKMNGEINIPRGSTLHVSPGTRVLLGPGAGIVVSGTIQSRGERSNRITFTSDGSTSGSWNEILLDHATDSAFTFCDFSRATWAIHSHFTNLSVSNCSFKNNYGGIRFQSGPLEIQSSVFQDNTIGIRAFRGSAVIKNNTISKNEVGIFIREKGSGVRIRNNNIVDNRAYGIRSGDFNNEDIDAVENWWGPGKASQAIFDGSNEAGIGIVRFEPVSKKPFPDPSLK